MNIIPTNIPNSENPPFYKYRWVRVAARVPKEIRDMYKNNDTPFPMPGLQLENIRTEDGTRKWYVVDWPFWMKIEDVYRYISILEQESEEKDKRLDNG